MVIAIDQAYTCMYMYQERTSRQSSRLNMEVHVHVLLCSGEYLHNPGDSLYSTCVVLSSQISFAMSTRSFTNRAKVLERNPAPNRTLGMV